MSLLSSSLGSSPTSVTSRRFYPSPLSFRSMGATLIERIFSLHDELTSPAVGLHPVGLQGLYSPSFKIKEGAQRQQQRHQWFNRWGSLHVWSKDLEQNPTVYSGRQGKTWRQPSVLGEEGDYQFIGGTDGRLAHWLPGKPAEGHTLLAPLSSPG